MLRKSWFILGIFVIISVFSISALQAATVLKFGHTDPPDSPRHQAALLFADKVKQYTNGAYEVNVFHSETLGSDPKLIELVKLGGVDFCVSGIAIYANQLPEIGLQRCPTWLRPSSRAGTFTTTRPGSRISSKDWRKRTSASCPCGRRASAT